MNALAVVYVSGCPGAGKSTLAEPLADILGLPLISKDTIKEGLFDAVPARGESPAEWSRVLSGAAMELLWALARQPSSVMLEANFRPHDERQRARLAGLDRQLVEVYCACPAEIAAVRYAERARLGTRRRGDVHVLTELSVEMLAEFDVPMGLGQLITVDTSVPVDVESVADQVAERLRCGSARRGLERR